MLEQAAVSATMPLGIVLRRAPGVTRWQRWVWSVAGVLPGAARADWQVLRSDADVTEYHAATVPLELHRTYAEAYRQGLSAQVPCLYVVMRETGDDKRPLEIVLLTASPFEAQDYADNGEDIVEKVTMPDGIVAWVRDFTRAHHQEEAFVKRRRDRQKIDQIEDGIGDARISQLVDVYRTPASRRKERLQRAGGISGAGGKPPLPPKRPRPGSRCVKRRWPTARTRKSFPSLACQTPTR